MHLPFNNNFKVIEVFIILFFKYIRCNTTNTGNGNFILDKEKCYEDLGCIKVTPEWYHKIYRPVNLLPSDRHAVNTIFVHWVKREYMVSPEIIGTNCCHFNHYSTLKLLVHDFTSNGYITWIQHLSRLLLLNPHSDLNVVSVDWSAGAEPPYDQAIANARLVALEISHFLDNIQFKSLTPRDVHIIGHGVGAHIAGYVGKMNRLQRITALDPSGLYFQNMPSIVRLHKDDAEYIEVLHTNAVRYGQGNKELLGHVDFFANGGRKQPGCKYQLLSLKKVKRGNLKLGETLPGCSHKRSLKYYLETLINQSCVFLGIACKSYKDFLEGKCSCGVNMENCLSLNTLRPPRSVNNMHGYYFVTSSSRPFCGKTEAGSAPYVLLGYRPRNDADPYVSSRFDVETLKVTMIAQSSPTNELYVNGYFNITIPQAIGDVNFLINENSIISALITDKQNSFMVFRSTPPPLVLPIKCVHLNWLHRPISCFWCTELEITSFMVQKMTDNIGDKPQWFCAVHNSSTSAIHENNRHLRVQTLYPCNNLGFTPITY